MMFASSLDTRDMNGNVGGPKFVLVDMLVFHLTNMLLIVLIANLMSGNCHINSEGSPESKANYNNRLPNNRPWL